MKFSEIKRGKDFAYKGIFFKRTKVSSYSETGGSFVNFNQDTECKPVVKFSDIKVGEVYLEEDNFMRYKKVAEDKAILLGIEDIQFEVNKNTLVVAD